MSSSRLNNSIPARGVESFRDRLNYCVRLLYVHGLATETEAKKIWARVSKRATKEEKESANAQL